MDRDEVRALAKLARIEITDAEAEKLSHEFAKILDYVGEVREVGKSNKSDKLKKEEVYNIMREDGEPHAPGIYTEDILNNAPGRKDNYIKVKKIL